jgi:hypothetical protein
MRRGGAVVPRGAIVKQFVDEPLAAFGAMHQQVFQLGQPGQVDF